MAANLHCKHLLWLLSAHQLLMKNQLQHTWIFFSYGQTSQHTVETSGSLTSADAGERKKKKKSADHMPQYMGQSVFGKVTSCVTVLHIIQDRRLWLRKLRLWGCAQFFSAGDGLIGAKPLLHSLDFCSHVFAFIYSFVFWALRAEKQTESPICGRTAEDTNVSAMR